MNIEIMKCFWPRQGFLLSLSIFVAAAYWGRNKSSAKPYALMSDLGFPAAFKLPRFHEGGQLSSLCTVLEMTSRTDGYHTLIRGFYRLTIFDAGLPLSKDGCLSQRTSRVP